MKEEYKQFGRVGVLMGGNSSEREISLKSGRAVYEALSSELDDVVAVDIIESHEAAVINYILSENIDTAFIALHGELGEDGSIQKILEEHDVPYTGSGVKASQLAFNKAFAQQIFQEKGIEVPPFISLSKKISVSIEEIISVVNGFPLVIKPACEGSSIGIKFANNEEQLKEGLSSAFTYGDAVLIEKHIKGKELTVGILNDEALPVVEIRPKREYFDFIAKYQEGMTEYIVPAKLPQDIVGVVQDMSLKAHKVLGCYGFSRVDLILDQDMNPFILEVNTIPGFTSTSLLPKAARCSGINFNQLCLQLLGLAYGKKKKEVQFTNTIH